jgi:Bax protein
VKVTLPLQRNRPAISTRKRLKFYAIASFICGAAFVFAPAMLMVQLLDEWRMADAGTGQVFSAPVAPVVTTAPSPLISPRDVRAAASVAKVKFVFASAGYSLDAVRGGQAVVPRIQHDYLPYDLSDIAQPSERKTFFLHFMLPYVLEANHRVTAQRTKLTALAAKLKAAMPLTGADVEWLARLGREYGVQPDNLSKLMARVDVVPPSLALAQGAIESGWGTSRFAQEGNAPFGQWTTQDYDGLVPRAREAGKTHKVRAFETIGESVASYLRNLNTHRAYREFRERRAAFRMENKPLESLPLALSLASYSQKGAHYVNLLRRVIRGNKLGALDNARLGVQVMSFHPDA